MARLRAPDGCPWDVEQTFESIAPYTIEEAYEVADAIERQDMEDLVDELGDLLLQVVYHARIAEERGAFTFQDVANAISQKMVRRHPHVFAGAESFDWHEIKAGERAEKAARRAARGRPVNAAPPSALDGVASGLPALSHALKLQARAASVGFDWQDPRDILDKVVEEAHEIVEAQEADARDPAGARGAVSEEFGDLFFVLANLARRCGVDPEAATRATNVKFIRRFQAIEAALADRGLSARDASLTEMEAEWVRAKQRERGGG